MAESPHTTQNAKPRYPDKTAGSKLQTNIPTCFQHSQVRAVKAEFLAKAGEYASLNYIYVLSRATELVGVLSIKELFAAEDTKEVLNVMTTSVVSCHPYTLQERVALLALKHNIKAVPVVDKDKHFLGVVDSDDILDIMYEEINDNLFKLAGLTKMASHTDDVMKISLFTSLRHRLPWILLGLVGGLAIAQVINYFEFVLSSNLILASFIPLMVYMSNAVGQQLNAFMIRDSALHGPLNFGKYFFKQAWVVIMIAALMGGALGGFGYLFSGTVDVAMTLAISMFTTTTSSLITGLVIPYLFIQADMDPANAAGPIGTFIQDFLSVVLYLSIASLILFV